MEPGTRTLYSLEPFYCEKELLQAANIKKMHDYAQRTNLLINNDAAHWVRTEGAIKYGVLNSKTNRYN